MDWRTTFWRVVDLIIGGLFIYAGVLKALDPAAFARDIDNYKLLPWSIGVRLAFYLPWLEILCGLAVVTRRLYRGGLLVLAALLALFIAASVIAKGRGIDISCGCFGHITKNFSFTWHLVLDFCLLAAVVASFWRTDRLESA
jgi:putative oxidoreductase